MALPNSFQAGGFVTPALIRNKVRLKNGQFLKPLLIGMDGPTDSGKTEFAMSAPGVIQMVSIDRNCMGVFDNPNAPATRNPNVGIKVCEVPLEGTARQTDFQTYHVSIRTAFYGALDNKDSTVVIVDGDSDWYELHTVALFGKTKGIFPQTKYGDLYAEKRAILARAFDAGKIVFFTNKVREEYEAVMKEDGTPELDPTTKEPMRRPSGRMVAQGFKDHDYLYGVWLRCMYQPATTRQMGKKTVEIPQQWGVCITKCKHNMGMIGTELWGEDCNFKRLVETIYPNEPLARWGF